MNADETKEYTGDIKTEIRVDTHNSCRRHYGTAKFHIELAEYAFERRHGPGELDCIYRALVDNLYTAAELLVETELILLNTPYKDNHDGIREAYRKLVENQKGSSGFY